MTTTTPPRNGARTLTRPPVSTAPTALPVTEQAVPTSTPGVLRWADPYGAEPEFAPTLRINPGQWAVVYEGTGRGWVQSTAYQWLAESERALGFRVIWVPLDAAGQRLGADQVWPRMEAQSSGAVYIQYGSGPRSPDGPFDRSTR